MVHHGSEMPDRQDYFFGNKFLWVPEIQQTVQKALIFHRWNMVERQRSDEPSWLPEQNMPPI